MPKQRWSKGDVREFGQSLLHILAPGLLEARQAFEVALTQAKECGGRPERIREILFPGNSSLLTEIRRAARSETDLELKTLGFGERRCSKPAAAFWGASLAELAADDSLRLDRAGFVRDRAVQIYDELAPLIQPQRRRNRLTRTPSEVKYNQAAMKLAAELVSTAYFPCVTRLLPSDIKSRLQRRHQP